MLHGFYKKEKITFGVNQSQFQALCKDMRLSFPVMNKVTPSSQRATPFYLLFMATAFVAVPNFAGLLFKVHLNPEPSAPSGCATFLRLLGARVSHCRRRSCRIGQVPTIFTIANKQPRNIEGELVRHRDELKQADARPPHPTHVVLRALNGHAHSFRPPC